MTADQSTTTEPGPAEATQMFKEAGQAPQLTRAQIARNEPVVSDLAHQLRVTPPRAVITLGRGSSDNAATFARYLIETRLGVMTSSASPSVTSVYDSAPELAQTLCLAISQSGKSPDLLAAAQAAAEAGAQVVALVNDEASPLAELADVVIPLGAGAELSVAATKSYLAANTALLHLIARWTGDAALDTALQILPGQMERAWGLDWGPALEALQDARSLYVVGRGVGLGAAQEAALKFKETCGLHAEAFSAAEVRHGPMALVGRDFPVLALAQDDETRQGTETLAAEFALRGGAVLLAGAGDAAKVGAARLLPTVKAHPAAQPILLIQSFYRLANALSVTRGFNPDRPPHLNKITETR